MAAQVARTPDGWWAACLDCQDPDGQWFDLGEWETEEEAFAAALSHDLNNQWVWG